MELVPQPVRPEMAQSCWRNFRSPSGSVSGSSYGLSCHHETHIRKFPMMATAVRHVALTGEKKVLGVDGDQKRSTGPAGSCGSGSGPSGPTATSPCCLARRRNSSSRRMSMMVSGGIPSSPRRRFLDASALKQARSSSKSASPSSGKPRCARRVFWA